MSGHLKSPLVADSCPNSNPKLQMVIIWNDIVTRSPNNADLKLQAYGHTCESSNLLDHRASDLSLLQILNLHLDPQGHI